MGKVKAPDISLPKRGLTDFERKIADILFAETSADELKVERVLDVAIAISDGLKKDAVDGDRTEEEGERKQNREDMRMILISDEDYEFLKDLQHELNTQENDGEAEPIYWGVMEHKMEAAPEGCGDAFIYMGDGRTMTTEEAVRYVGENIHAYREELQEWWKDVDKNCMDDVVAFIHDGMEVTECRVVWMDEVDHISRETGAFLTKRACKKYIETCHYNHSKPHTYAMTAYRNFEYERLLKILKTMKMEYQHHAEESSVYDGPEGVWDNR